MVAQNQHQNQQPFLVQYPSAASKVGSNEIMPSPSHQASVSSNINHSPISGREHAGAATTISTQ